MQIQASGAAHFCGGTAAKNGPVFRTEKWPRYSPASERPKSGSIFRTEKRDRFRCQKVAQRSRIFWQRRCRKSGRGARRGLTFWGWGLAQNSGAENRPRAANHNAVSRLRSSRNLAQPAMQHRFKLTRPTCIGQTLCNRRIVPQRWGAANAS